MAISTLGTNQMSCFPSPPPVSDPALGSQPIYAGRKGVLVGYLRDRNRTLTCFDCVNSPLRGAYDPAITR